MFFYNEESTLDNMTPDHIRILDHKFLQTFQHTCGPTGVPKVKARQVELLCPDGSIVICKDAKHAAIIAGVDHKSIRSAMNRGFKSNGHTARFIEHSLTDE